MLKTIDVLIGLSVVMLLLSMIITMITQFVTSVMNSRGKHLLSGLVDMLRQIDPSLTPLLAGQIARAVLLHPLIRDGERRLGAVIHREELTKLLLELATTDGPMQLEANARASLQKALVATGVCRAGSDDDVQQQIRELIKNIGTVSLQLELSHPELTNNARARIAILQQASSGLVAKINLWFDQTIDRISDRFTGHARAVSFFAVLVVAPVIQLDTATLVSRLATDDSVRNALVAQAQNIQKNQNTPLRFNDSQIQNIRDLMVNNLVGVPVSWSDWIGRWSPDNFFMKLVGILLSTVLLTLGAPFWYNALQNLIRLRSLATVKDDQQRQERQLALPAARAIAAASIASSDEEHAVIKPQGPAAGI